MKLLKVLLPGFGYCLCFNLGLVLNEKDEGMDFSMRSNFERNLHWEIYKIKLPLFEWELNILTYFYEHRAWGLSIQFQNNYFERIHAKQIHRSLRDSNVNDTYL
jgi:hypothetical protein